MEGRGMRLPGCGLEAVLLFVGRWRP